MHLFDQSADLDAVDAQELKLGIHQERADSVAAAFADIVQVVVSSDRRKRLDCVGETRQVVVDVARPGVVSYLEQSVRRKQKLSKVRKKHNLFIQHLFNY